MPEKCLEIQTKDNSMGHCVVPCVCSCYKQTFDVCMFMLQANFLMCVCSCYKQTFDVCMFMLQANFWCVYVHVTSKLLIKFNLCMAGMEKIDFGIS